MWLSCGASGNLMPLLPMFLRYRQFLIAPCFHLASSLLSTAVARLGVEGKQAFATDLNATRDEAAEKLRVMDREG